MAVQISQGLDTGGTITEQLVTSVATREGLVALPGTKYGSNNGFDHVFQGTDGKIYLFESKQVSNGTMTLSPSAAGGHMQMSDAWITQVVNNLGPNSAAATAITNARASGTFVKSVVGFDRTTGLLTMVRVDGF